jgi:hypothetical protein
MRCKSLDQVQKRPSTRNLAIELHGPDCEQVFLRALAGYDYQVQQSGELTICRNIRART